MIDNIRHRFVQSWKLARSLVLFSTLLAFSPFSFSQNLLTNPGFENSTNGWTLDGEASAQFTESNGRSGNRLTHWSSSSSYTAETKQTVTGLAAGIYRLSAYTVGNETAGAWLWADCNGQSFATPVPSSPWGSWAQVTVDNIEVTGTSCEVGISTENSEWTSIDDVDFELVSGGDSTEVVIEENATGFCGVDGSIDNNHAGFTGDGFSNTDNAFGASVTYSINADFATSVMLDIRFASASNRPANIDVNGAVADAANFTSTGSWTSWINESITIALQAGENTVRLVSQTADGLPNIDSLTVVGNGLNPGSCNAVPNSCDDMNDNGNSLSSCNGNPAVCLLGGGVGNYRVAMKFDAGYNGELEVFSESRRLMFTSSQQSTSTARCVHFLVDVRDPEGEPYQSDRGTSGLNLRITKGAGALTVLTASPVTSPKTLFIAGDSTVSDQSPQLFASPTSRYTGWGQFIPAYFGDGILVANYADSGEGTAAFRTDGGGLWNKIDARLESGDWVMIQLGHNDKTTSASLYRSRITNMVTAIRNKGANPILITPMIRNTGDPLAWQHVWGNLNIRNELVGVANAQNVPLIDLMKLSSEWAGSIGQSAAQAYFVGNDRTHSNEIGAELFTQTIVNEIHRQSIGINNYLRNP